MIYNYYKFLIDVNNFKVSLKKKLGIKPKKVKELSIEEIFQIEDDNDLLVEISMYLNNKLDSGQKLNTLEIDILALMTYVMETDMGGLNGFIYSGGHLYHEAINALTKIGAKSDVNTLTKLLEYFPKNKVPKDPMKREEVLSEELEIAASKLDNKFNRDRLIKLTYKYLINNKSKFICK